MAEERKVCVVTGSSSGIGAATVRLYAKQGWNVVVNYSREAAPAEAVASECRKLGADVLVARADIAADADCRRLAGEVEARFGRADVLVNNAGTTKFVAAKDLDGLDADDFQRIYARQRHRRLPDGARVRAAARRASPARRSSTSRRSPR